MTTTAISSILLIVMALNVLAAQAQPFADAGEFSDSKTYLIERHTCSRTPRMVYQKHF